MYTHIYIYIIYIYIYIYIDPKVNLETWVQNLEYFYIWRWTYDLAPSFRTVLEAPVPEKSFDQTKTVRVMNRSSDKQQLSPTVGWSVTRMRTYMRTHIHAYWLHLYIYIYIMITIVVVVVVVMILPAIQHISYPRHLAKQRGAAAGPWRRGLGGVRRSPMEQEPSDPQPQKFGKLMFLL